MDKKVDRDKKTIKEVYDSFKNGELVVDYTYQRRKIWSEQDQIRLIETILLEQIVPEVFFWKSSVDPETGKSITHIVDGQQRINAIVEFLDGLFKLNSKSLLTDEIKDRVGNRFFSELSDDDKSLLWTYKLSVVDIDRKCSKEIIKQMFSRLNMTNYSLNTSEKRHILGGEFGCKSEALATDDFWTKHNVFSANDARRMLDVDFCCNIYILADIGLTAEINQKKIGDYYKDYNDEFDPNKELITKISQVMSMIDYLTDRQTAFFISKKAQMFTLFATLFSFIENGTNNLTKRNFSNFKNFVMAYSLYEETISEQIKQLGYDNSVKLIDIYKTASSEGVNSLRNRVLRKQTLEEVLEPKSENISKGFQEIIRVKNEYSDKHEQIDLINDEY